MNNEILCLSEISKIYNQGEDLVQVIDNTNLAIHAGEIVALTGPSGCGKTSLLQIAGLIDRPTSGKIIIMNEDCSKLTDNQATEVRRRSIGFVYQAHNLMPEFSAIENLILTLMIRGKKKHEAQQIAKEKLAEIGLAHRLNHRPCQLSGGEQQRVAIARAICDNPPILLADEPTGNLDPDNAQQVFDLMIALARQNNSATLIITHNYELACKADRVLTITGGKINAL